MKSAICPKCFAQLTQEQWVYRCQNTSCISRGKNVAYSETVKGSGDEPACHDCGENFVSPFCPKCGFFLREDEAGCVTISISLVGAQGSGKSHYLSVLVEEIKHNFCKTFDCALYPLGGDDTITQYNKNYYQPLYTRGQCLAPTEQDDLDPLIYSAVFKQNAPVKALNLVLYDACGANFESISEMTNLNRSLYHCGAIIFLIDPAQLPGIAERLPQIGRSASESDAEAHLARTIHLIRAGTGNQSLTKNLDLPIAVCLTKLDALSQVLDAASFVKAPSRQLRTKEFELHDFNACSCEVQSMLEAWGGGEIVSQIKSQFANYAFFGLSSLGQQPGDNMISDIKPHRVIDPLLWILNQSKILK